MVLLPFLLFVTLNGGVQSSCGTSALTQTMFSSPKNPQVNPFSDLETEYHMDTLKNKRPSFRQTRTSDLEELFEQELIDQLKTQPERDFFLYLGFLSNGPMIINLLGRVMILSSIKDFSLIERSPNFTFKHINYPQSFRASFVQIVSEVYNTFLVAHSNMDITGRQIAEISNSVKTALKLLTSASFPLLQSLLPRTLMKIDRASNESSNRSLKIMNKFSDLILIVDELVELTESSSGRTVSTSTAVTIDQEQMNNREKDSHEYYLQMSDTLRSLFSSTSVGSRRTKEKAEETLEELKNAEQRYNSTYLQIMNFNEKMTEFVINISSMNMIKIDLNDINSILIEVMKFLKEMKSHWNDLVRFFDKLTNRVKVTIEVSLKNFLDSVKESHITKSSQLSSSIPSFDADYLKEDIFIIHSESQVLSIISRSYVNISKEFIFNQMDELKNLIIADTTQKRIELNNGLQVQIEKLQLTTRSVIQQHEEEYLEATRNRQDQLEQFIQNAQLQSLEGTIG